MVLTDSSELIKEIQNVTKIQTLQGVPRTISNQVVPVMEVNPKAIKEARVASTLIADTTSGSLLIANGSQDVYVTSLFLSVAKTAANTANYVRITCTQFGAIRTLLQIAVNPSTAEAFSSTISFPHSVKIDRNTAINVSTDNGTASIDIYAGASYVVDENSNA